jgi:hypothetical protein
MNCIDKGPISAKDFHWTVNLGKGSRGHKDLKVGVVEVTEEVEHILDTGVGCPMEATSKDFTTQNETFAKMAIKSESKSQILLNPHTNIYCSTEVVGGSNISQSLLSTIGCLEGQCEAGGGGCYEGSVYGKGMDDSFGILLEPP